MDRPEQLEPAQRVQGWGTDADPKRRPGVPLNERPHRQPGALWERIPQQRSAVKVLVSPSRPDGELPPVYGTAEPPHLLSGLLRRLAYRYPDHLNRHWMLLIAADRVDSVESHVERLVLPVVAIGVGVGFMVLLRRASARV